MAKTKVAINAGHGVKDTGVIDPGAIGKKGLQEFTQNMEVVLLVEAKLKARGYDTLFIQDGDLDDVVAASNKWSADYFLAFHTNASTSPEARGVETYAYAPGGTGEKLAKAVQKALVQATKLVDRGVKFAKFYVLKYTKCPAILVELGFISNKTEEGLMRDPAWDCKVAEAIAQGIMEIVPPTK